MNHPAPTRRDREPITLATVEAAILHLMEAGKPPSEPNIRGLIGGSPNTIHPLIQRWFADRAPGLLAGQISVVQSSDLPQAVHALVAELREDARRAADDALAEAVASAKAAEAEARQAAEAARGREAAAARRAQEVEDMLGAIRVDLDLARAEVAAARSVTETAVAERREAESARDAAAAMARDAERREASAQASLRSAEDTIGGLRLEAESMKTVIADLRGQVAARETEIERISADAAASMASLRESIDEIKAAHMREVQGLRSQQADAAARWAEAKGALERRAADAEKAAQAARSVADDAKARLASLEAELQRAIENSKTSDRIAGELRLRLAELEKIAARVPDGVADLIERMAKIESRLGTGHNGGD